MKIKDTIIKVITIIDVLVLLVSIGGLDYEGNGNKPYIGLLISLLWLALFAYANRER